MCTKCFAVSQNTKLHFTATSLHRGPSVIQTLAESHWAQPRLRRRHRALSI